MIKVVTQLVLLGRRSFKLSSLKTRASGILGAVPVVVVVVV